ncbi:hypothetical protein HDU67_006229 [Dinochytrium kinnereticum]|nr:hypothetical protein HDU67_006229 [Dinochytrium kinnereticum]
MRTLELNENLKGFNLTANGFIYVMGTNGIMIGSSTNETLLVQFPNDTVLMKKANDLTDSRINNTYQILLKRAPERDLALLPTTAQYDVDGYLFQHRFFQDAFNLTLVVVFGAPKKDYIGDVDELESQLLAGLRSINVKVIIISVSMFIVCTVISIVLTLLVLSKPLSILSRAMQDATRFDFTLLREGKLDHRSLIFELATMETSFVTMLKKFAEAIQSNKVILRGPSNWDKRNVKRDARE